MYIDPDKFTTTDKIALGFIIFCLIIIVLRK